MSVIGDVTKSADVVAKAVTGDLVSIITVIVALVALKIIWLVWLTLKAKSTDRYKAAETAERKRMGEQCQGKYIEMEKLKAEQVAHKEKLDDIDKAHKEKLTSIDNELTLHKEMTNKDIDRIDKRLENVSVDIKELTVTVTNTNESVSETKEAIGRVEATLGLIAQKWLKND